MMGRFRYRAIAAKDGETMRGVMEAASQAEVIAKLQQAGHLPVSAEEVGAREGVRRPRRGRFMAWGGQRGRVGRRDIVLFTRELATLIQAGLPLDTALQTLARLDLSPAMRELVKQLLDNIRGGMALSAALAAQGERFDAIYRNMIRAAEAGGALEAVIGRLADYLESMARLRARVVTATVYPAILFVFCIASLLLMMLFVVPRFAPLFAGAEHTLPWITQAVFALSDGMRRHGWWCLVLLIGAVWLLARGLADPATRLRLDGALLRLPGLGKLLQELEMARFARALGTAVANGVPLLSAVRIVKAVIANRALGKAMDAVVAGLERGQTMAKPLREAGVCPELAVQLIEIGEAGGQLEAMLEKIADIYDRQTHTALQRALTILEPVLILGLGGLIALIILSILLAVLGLNEIVI